MNVLDTDLEVNVDPKKYLYSSYDEQIRNKPVVSYTNLDI